MSVRILKDLLSLLVAITIFAVGFYLGGGSKLLTAEKNQDISTKKISSKIPQYKNNPFLPMGNRISVNNLPMELGYFTTRDDLDAVKDEMMRRFRESGLNPYYNQVSDEEGFIQATDPVKGEHRIVILKRTDDETLVFAGITPVIASNLIVKPDSSLGIPEDAINYIEVVNQDYGRVARTISFQLKGDKEKNRMLFLERAKSLGFEENEYLKLEDTIALSRDNMQIVAIISEGKGEDGGDLTSFVLNVMERGDEKD
jgi:hypothetical protein